MRAAPPIFVLAAPHSHGARLGAMLGCHPETFGLPELNLFVGDTLEQSLSEMADARQAHAHGLLRAVAYLFAGEQTIGAVAMARRWLARRMHWPMSRVFDELRAKVAPFRIVEKSRSNVIDADALERICETCPDAFYVHVIRHPFAFGIALLAEGGDTRHSLLEMTETKDGHPTLDPQLLWLGVERRIAGFLAKIPNDRQVHLRVEELFAAPHKRLASVARALGLSADRAAIGAMMHPEASPFTGAGPAGANLGDDAQFLQNPKFPVPLVASSTLDRPLPWRRDGAGFNSDVVEKARALGYV